MKLYILIAVLVIIIICMAILLLAKDDLVSIGNLVITETPEGLEMYIQLSSNDLNALKKEKQVILNIVYK